MTQPQPPYQQQPQYQPYQPPYTPPPANLRGRDGAQYVRQQKPHSLTKHLLLCLIGVGFVTIPLYSLSPNHYWTA